jgi:hypothetical protein
MSTYSSVGMTAVHCTCTQSPRALSQLQGYDKLIQDWRRTQRVSVGQQRKARKHPHAEWAWAGAPRSSTRAYRLDYAMLCYARTG